MIAEGDVLTLCIRLFGELLQRRYAIPPPLHSDTLLWRHAQSIFEENCSLVKELEGGVRGNEAAALVIPQAELIVSSFGHALAYSAAVQAHLPQPIIDLYECAAIRQHSIWYSETAGISSLEQRRREDRAVSRVLVDMKEYLTMLRVNGHVTAPIISEDAWAEYLDALPVFRGDVSPYSILPPSSPKQPVHVNSRL